jgi:hypothetical protein
MIKDMGLVFKYGLMEQSMKVCGEREKLKEEVSSGMQMVMYMTENGKRIKHTVMEFTFM